MKRKGTTPMMEFLQAHGLPTLNLILTLILMYFVVKNHQRIKNEKANR